MYSLISLSQAQKPDPLVSSWSSKVCTNIPTNTALTTTCWTPIVCQTIYTPSSITCFALTPYFLIIIHVLQMWKQKVTSVKWSQEALLRSWVRNSKASQSNSEPPHLLHSNVLPIETIQICHKNYFSNWILTTLSLIVLIPSI